MTESLSESSKKLEDYYLYYEVPENSRTGAIRAISPHKLNDWENMSFLKIPATLGANLVSGKESLFNWSVVFNERTLKMVLVETKQALPKACPVNSIPQDQEDAEIIVSWDGTNFKVTAPKVEYALDGVNLDFFVTDEDEPYILHQHFGCQLIDAIDGNVTVAGINVPDEFSVYTRWLYERYQLVIER